MNELLLAGIAAGGGIAAGALVYLLFRKRASKGKEEGGEAVVALEILSEETVVPSPVLEDVPFSLPTGARSASHGTHPEKHPVKVLDRGLRPTYEADDPPELPDSAIQTEWARRQVGPVEGGRMKGVCSGCGTNLSVSNARPLRIACPVCGRTRLLAA